MAKQPNYLFAKGDLSASLRAQEEGIAGFVREIPEAQFLQSSDEQMVEHVLSNVSVEPVTLYEERSGSGNNNRCNRVAG